VFSLSSFGTVLCRRFYFYIFFFYFFLIFFAHRYFNLYKLLNLVAKLLPLFKKCHNVIKFFLIGFKAEITLKKTNFIFKLKKHLYSKLIMKYSTTSFKIRPVIIAILFLLVSSPQLLGQDITIKGVVKDHLNRS